MNMTVSPSALCGSIRAIPSKSYMHRALICAAFSNRETEIICPEIGTDILRTKEALCAMGAEINFGDYSCTVLPAESTPEKADILCGESGSTLRFLLPIVSALGISGTFYGEGKLASRPMEPLLDALRNHGISISADRLPFRAEGKMTCGSYSLDGSISSQFFSGLLLAFPLIAGKSSLHVEGNLQSAPYLEMTRDVMRSFGVKTNRTGSTYCVLPGTYRSSGKFDVEGDWSAAAPILVAGALAGEDIFLYGLNDESKQGDRRILSILRDMGASVILEKDGYSVQKSQLHGIEIDLADIPDLAPSIAVAAINAEGTTILHNAERLRYKESDRLAGIQGLVTAFGGKFQQSGNTIRIQKGNAPTVPFSIACDDHRMAMAATVAATCGNTAVTIQHAESVMKSYPSFFRDFSRLGGNCTL